MEERNELCIQDVCHQSSLRIVDVCHQGLMNKLPVVDESNTNQ